MRVTNVEAVPVSVPMATTYETSLSVGTAGERQYDHVLVRVETNTGITGFGEIAPEPYWPHGLTQSACMALVTERLAPAVEGRYVRRIPRIVDDLERHLVGEPFPLCGIDMALHDALGKHLEVPVYDLLGGPTMDEPTLDLHYSIGIKPLDEIRAEASDAAEAGFKAFKMKVGSPDFETEYKNVVTVADTVPEASIRVDANQGWTVPEAIHRIRRLDEAADGLVLVEQPVNYENIEGMAHLRETVTPPIMADESCFSPDDVATLARRKACDIVNIKLGKTGGLYRAGDVGTVAMAHGLPCFMGSMLELGIGTAANAHFAASSPAITYPTGALNIHAEDTLITNPDMWTPSSSTFTIPDDPGLGIALDEEALEHYRTD